MPRDLKDVMEVKTETLNKSLVKWLPFLLVILTVALVTQGIVIWQIKMGCSSIGDIDDDDDANDGVEASSSYDLHL